MARFPKPIPNPFHASNEEKTDPDIPAPFVPDSEPTVVAQMPGKTPEAPPLSPIHALMKDPSITEIMVNDIRKIFVERDGLLMETSSRFESIEQLNRTIQTLLEGSGRILTYDQPFADFRLSDGSRVTIAIPPITIGGPTLSIRRFAKHFRTDEWIQAQVMPQEVADFLRQAVIRKKNILISGGTSTGKTTLLNQLVDAIPRGERLVVIEETPELSVPHSNAVRLQPKPSTPTQPGVTERDLVALALRMRPDRILMGELRRAEAFDFLLAMNTGHDGCLSTLHANSPRDALARMESLCMLAGVALPLAVIRKHMSRALDYIVQLTRLRGGQRRITGIAQVTGIEGDTLTMQDVWTYDETTGVLRSTGLVPQE